ncbi:PilW family protein [uncultured Thiothrix sp.]|uniref:PilW family protein n=1 Tax=uncultured Thiothrix sp. TaxID=223185 RepID=UPI00261E76AE|nr:PilW family protein [uncultured Thiothrix sp.]
MRQRGFNLIELMIAMVIGLFIMGGVISLFISNRQTFQSNQGIFQIQESMRMAFEILSRDLRHTGFTPCGNGTRVANVLNPTPANGNLLNWVGGLRGADGNTAIAPVVIGTGIGQRVAGTSAVLVQGVEGSDRTVQMHTTTGTPSFTLFPDASTNFSAGDILMVCDTQQATIFQASQVTANEIKYVINGGFTPGNCQLGLGIGGGCTATPAFLAYNPNANITRFMSAIWYVGNNGRPEDGGRSLFRARIDNTGQVVREEIVAGVSNLQINYHRTTLNSWDTATAIDTANAWANVNALRLQLSLVSAESNISTDSSINNGRLQRNFTQIIALRNRL